MRLPVLLALCFVVGCGRAPSPTVVEVSPKEVREAELPTEVTIRGRGLAQTVSLSLDDEQRVTLTDPVVVLGETQVAVLAHRAADELQVWVEGLAPGSYDLRVGSGAEQTVLRDAFRVLAETATSGVGSDGRQDSGVANVTDTHDDSATPISSETTAASESGAPPESSASAPMSGAPDAGSGAASGAPGSDASTSSSSVETPGPTSSDDSDGNSTSEPVVCVASTPLFFDDYESGNFDAWTDDDTMGSCQTSGIATGDALSGSRAFTANVTCGLGNGDHENYGALQFNGDTVRTSFSNTGLGIDAPHGIVIDFWARAQWDFAPSAGQWVSFLLLSGTCDWSDTVFSVGTGNATSRLAISHVDAEDTTPFADAAAFPKDTWTKVTAYVNYHTGTFVVWQDGTPVTQASFERPGTTLCHVRLGAYISGSTDNAQVAIDDPTLWKLNADPPSFDHAPCLTSD